MVELKKERFMGYKIDSFNYRTVRWLFEEIFYRNSYTFETKNKKPIILDCGANIGMATLFFKWLYPQSMIYSFEPDKTTFQLLQKNIVQNKLKDVHIFNCALTDKNGKTDFFINLHDIGYMANSTKKQKVLDSRIMVDCISLSSFLQNKKIKNVDCIKMDIEGSEKEVIEDLEKNNQLPKIRKLVIEYHHLMEKQKSNLGDFLQIFEKNGFNYQINARYTPINSDNIFQNIYLYIYN